MNRIIDWFLFTSTLTAVCAVGLCMATERLISEIAPKALTPFHFFVFGATLLVYNLHHSIRKLKAYSQKEIGSNNWERHIIATITGLIMLAISIVKIPLSIAIVCGGLGVISLSYSLPLLPLARKKTIRERGQLKIVALAIVWTFVTSVLPILYLQKSLLNYPLEILIRLAFISALCMLFDIRDIKTDSANNIRTLPQILGRKKSYLMVTVCILCFLALSVLQYYRYPHLQRLSGAFCTTVATLAVAKYLQKHTTERDHLILGDGVMLLYSFLVIGI